MTAPHQPIFPRHRLLNQHRALLKMRPNLTTLAPLTAQRLLFVGLLDHLAGLPPFVAMDEWVAHDFPIIVNNILDAARKPVSATPLDVLRGMSLPDPGTGRRYGFRLMQYFGRMLDQDKSRKGPINVVNAILDLLASLPKPWIVDVDFSDLSGAQVSALDRDILDFTGVVWLPTDP